VTLGSSAVGVPNVAVIVCGFGSVFTCAATNTDATGAFSAAISSSPSLFQIVPVTATLDPYYAGVALLGQGTTSVGGNCSGLCQ